MSFCFELCRWIGASIFLACLSFSFASSPLIDDLVLEVDGSRFTRTGNLFTGKDACDENLALTVSNLKIYETALNSYLSFRISFQENGDIHWAYLCAENEITLPDELLLPTYDKKQTVQEYIKSLNDRSVNRFVTRVNRGWSQSKPFDYLGVNIKAYLSKIEPVTFLEKRVVKEDLESIPPCHKVFISYIVSGMQPWEASKQMLCTFDHVQVHAPERETDVYYVDDDRLQTVHRQLWDRSASEYVKWCKANNFIDYAYPKYCLWESDNRCDAPLIFSGRHLINGASLLNGPLFYLKHIKNPQQRNSPKDNCSTIFYRDQSAWLCTKDRQRYVESDRGSYFIENGSEHMLSVISPTNIPLYLEYSSINGSFNGGCYYHFKSRSINNAIVTEEWEEHGSGLLVALTSHANTIYPFFTTLDLNNLSLTEKFGNLWKTMTHFAPYIDRGGSIGVYINLDEVAKKDKGKHASRCAEFLTRIAWDKKVLPKTSGNYAGIHRHYEDLNSLSVTGPLESLSPAKGFHCKTLAAGNSKYAVDNPLYGFQNCKIETWDLSQEKIKDNVVPSIIEFLKNNIVQTFKINLRQFTEGNKALLEKAVLQYVRKAFYPKHLDSDSDYTPRADSISKRLNHWGNIFKGTHGLESLRVSRNDISDNEDGRFFSCWLKNLVQRLAENSASSLKHLCFDFVKLPGNEGWNAVWSNIIACVDQFTNLETLVFRKTNMSDDQIVSLSQNVSRLKHLKTVKMDLPAATLTGDVTKNRLFNHDSKTMQRTLGNFMRVNPMAVLIQGAADLLTDERSIVYHDVMKNLSSITPQPDKLILFDPRSITRTDIDLFAYPEKVTFENR